MPKMKKLLFIFIICLLFYCNNVLSQGISDPITGSTDPNNVGEIISDFGPRYADGSIYHSGLDYNRNLYDPAYAVETGDVTRIRSLGLDNAYIEVGSWWYIHIQDELTPTYNWQIINDGNNGLYNDIVIIRMTDFNNEIVPIVAYVSRDSPLYSAGDLFSDPVTGTDVVLSTNIPQGDLVFRARNHSNEPHLHLQRKNDYWENPLNYVPYSNSANPAFDLQVKFKQLSNGNFIEYDPIHGENVFIESKINSQIDKDFDKLEIEYSTDNTNFSTLFDWTVSGQNHLDVNRTDGTSDNPKHVIHRYSADEHTEAQIEDKAEEGIFPVRVTLCSIDYYKGIWNTQDTETGSENVLNFIYPDGRYNIRVTAYDLTNNSSANNSEVIIDNLRPYIKKVVVRKGDANGEIAYTGEWTWNGSALEFNSQSSATIYDNEGIWIKAYTSEPMQSLYMGSFGQPSRLGVSENNGTEWIFIFTDEETLQTPINVLWFTSDDPYLASLDLAGNPLEGFSTSENYVSGTDIPKHLNDGSWYPSPNENSDSRHFITVEFYIPDVPTNVNATIDKPDRIVITWDQVSSGTYYRVYRGNSPSDATFPISDWISNTSFDDINVNSGDSYYYRVRSSASSDGSNPSSYSSAAMGSVTTGLTADFSYNQISFVSNDLQVQFYDNSVSLNSSIDLMHWNFGDGTTQSSTVNPLHTYTSKGTYTVTLTVTDANGNTESIENIVVVTENYDESINVEAYNIDLGGNNYEFHVNVWDEGGRDYDVMVNFGDEASDPLGLGETVVTHEYSVPMQTTTYYPSVTVTVYDPGYDPVYINQPINPPITIEQSYNLNVNISRNKQHVLPGHACGFEANVTGGTGNYNYNWIINKTPNDLDGLCDPDVSTDDNCIRDENRYETSDIVFPEEGDYKIFVSVWEKDGVRSGSAEYVLSVGEAQEDCILVDILEVGVANQYKFALGSEFGLFADITLKSDCDNYTQPNTIESIGKIEWEYDEREIRSLTFDSQDDWYMAYNKNVCLGEEHDNTLVTPGVHTIRAKVYGAYTSGGWGFTVLENHFTSVTKTIRVIDCESTISIPNKLNLNILLLESNNTIERGYIELSPQYHFWFNPTATININSGAKVHLIANNEITLKPGVHIKSGADFIAKIVDCPLVIDECEEYTDKSDKLKSSHEIIKENNPETKLDKFLVISARLYPNPTNSSFTVEILGEAQLVQSIEVYNIQGQLIDSKDNMINCTNTFDISNYPQGVYFVKINNFENQIVKKIIKQ